MKIFSQKQNKNGFSIVEVIVAVGIITIGIIPIITLFNQNLRSEIENKNVLIAAYLANESIEIVRQKRDNSWTAGDPWMTDISTGNVIVGLSDSDGDSNNIREGWKIDGSNNDRKKVYLSSNGSYVQHKASGDGTNWSDWGWTETPFERYLKIETGTVGCLGAGANCMQITSHVLFNGTTIVEITAYLYNGWK